MARYVVDAPTLVHLLDRRLTIGADHRLVAPSSVRSEALELLLGQVRRGERDEKQALERHDQLTGLKMRLLGDRVSRRTAWQLARKHDWSSLRDAEYLALARLQADALVTVDPELAAKAASVTRVAPLEELVEGG